MGTVVSWRFAGDCSHMSRSHMGGTSSPPVPITSAIPSGTPVPNIRSSRS